LFVQKIKGFNTGELVYFLRTNPILSKSIGFDSINNYIPYEAIFSVFKKKLDLSLLDDVISTKTFLKMIFVVL